MHDDERFVRRIVARLTRRHEEAEPRPWKMGDSAPELIDSMLRNIVGIEIAITSLVGKVKLSQNREARDYGDGAKVIGRVACVFGWIVRATASYDVHLRICSASGLVGESRISRRHAEKWAEGRCQTLSRYPPIHCQFIDSPSPGARNLAGCRWMSTSIKSTT